MVKELLKPRSRFSRRYEFGQIIFLCCRSSRRVFVHSTFAAYRVDDAVAVLLLRFFLCHETDCPFSLAFIYYVVIFFCVALSLRCVRPSWAPTQVPVRRGKNVLKPAAIKRKAISAQAHFLNSIHRPNESTTFFSALTCFVCCSRSLYGPFFATWFYFFLPALKTILCVNKLKTKQRQQRA